MSWRSCPAALKREHCRLWKWLLLGLLVVVFMTPALTSSAGPGAGPHFIELPYVTNYDGLGWLAFVSNRSGNTNLWTMRGDGSTWRELVVDGRESDPSWSGDGTRLAFVSDKDGNHEIYSIDRNGTNLVRLTNDTREDNDPAWSPDGALIAFTRWTDNTPSIWIMNQNGTNPQRLTFSYDTQPSWSPDGKKIVFTRSTTQTGSLDIYVINRNGTNAAALVNTSANESSPAFARDGVTLAYLSNNNGLYVPRVWIRWANGTAAQLTSNTADITGLAWSPNGDKTIYSQLVSNSSMDGNLFKIDVASKVISQVTSGSYYDRQPTWWP
ncbi:MAG: TolB family protein [Anaerolineae bacterium]